MLSQYGMRSFHVSYASLAKVCCGRYHVWHQRVLFKEKTTELDWGLLAKLLNWATPLHCKDACDEKRVSLSYLCLVAHAILISKVLLFCCAVVPIWAICWCSYLVSWLLEVAFNSIGYSEVHSNKRSTQCHGRCIEGIWIALVTFISYIRYICWLVTLCLSVVISQWSSWLCLLKVGLIYLPTYLRDVDNCRLCSQTGCLKL